jgi:DNA invertase Pin-like site-specific DNA recombinase
MLAEAHQKVKSSHLKRKAFLYIRQSTIRQVFENTESTKRQYALRQRATALGWPEEDIIVIDDDLGQSGASALGRQGFQRLVTEAGMGHAGIILGLEVSRLARNSTDWHRLLEICALTDTLILDEDGIYDPAHFNDRLLLGLKGTMSEAELHVLKARLQGGILNKARRGELQIHLPVGLVYDSQGKTILNPDRQVQHSFQLLFQTFRRTGAASATVKEFRKHGLLFPRKIHRNPSDLSWAPLQCSHVLRVLHNPRYAGAFVYGRSRMRMNIDGGFTVRKLPREEWNTIIPDMHPGYISWEEYEQNQKKLQASAQAHGEDRSKSPPREGPALLQGLVICGVCGMRMTVRYHQRSAGLLPDYVCQRDGIQNGESICQRIPGSGIDKSIGDLLVKTVSPIALEVALSVQQELQARMNTVDQLRRKELARLRYEADLAQRRYMQVDPDNRLVAGTLEAEWNSKLRALAEGQEEYERQSKTNLQILNDEHRAAIMALATDFPRLWRNQNTSDQERKRMVRLLIEDVTLTRAEAIEAHIRFRGGAVQSLTIPLQLAAWQQQITPPEVMSEIDMLLNHHTDQEVAGILNSRNIKSGAGKVFCARIVSRLRREHGFKSRFERLRNRGLLTLPEIAQLLGISLVRVKIWKNQGLLKAYAYNERNECLYEPPGDNPPRKMQGRKRRFRSDVHALSRGTVEVQCET